jgi:steroid delta-isomerase
MNRVTDHLDAFNHAVTTGDWTTFTTRFAEDARMTFVGVPAGPYTGRAAITEAYRTNPPTETISLVDLTTDADADTARFAWSSGPTGTMHLTWTPTGTVASLTITFD